MIPVQCKWAIKRSVHGALGAQGRELGFHLAKELAGALQSKKQDDDRP